MPAAPVIKRLGPASWPSLGNVGLSRNSPVLFKITSCGIQTCKHIRMIQRDELHMKGE